MWTICPRSDPNQVDVGTSPYTSAFLAPKAAKFLDSALLAHNAGGGALVDFAEGFDDLTGC